MQSFVATPVNAALGSVRQYSATAEGQPSPLEVAP